ncbi:NUDIX domain-containing protein [Deinococcus xianganensis]|uniref:NUDIX domain-containing protein n=1 Tax=Deinococcus xianganensis TaxID=1507289 RepID=A0A6I4YEH5_9DEIO|nr:NUDIX hydrolase [Deinococcus xianganensis]MXV18840.1 NUDIX domain-containing protein [Deinococcus xianganensis]
MIHPNWAALVEDDTQPWATLESRQIVSGFRTVFEDRVRLPSGVETTYQYRPRGPRAVFVLPVTAQGEAVLIRQYRYPLRATVTEVVAGGVERGEDLLAAAQRELHEEVGGVAAEWVPLPGFYPQPSISGVIFYPFVALGVTLGDMHHEDTETIERVVVPLAEAYRRLDAGEILDGSSSLAMWHARIVLAGRGLL